MNLGTSIGIAASVALTSALSACGGGGASTADGGPASTVSAAPTDITAAILANRDVVLSGDSVVEVPSGSTTYSGIVSGAGTLTIDAPSGSGTLILTGNSTFSLPASQQTETAVQTKSPTDPNHVHYWTILNPNPPAVIVKAGATLQLGTPSSTSGSIGSFSANIAAGTINLDNFQVDGTLVLESGPTLSMGVLSGTGVIQRPPAGTSAGALFLVGDNPFSGVYSQLFGGYFGNDHVIFSMPNATIFSNESFITAAPQAQFGDSANHQLKYPQTIWESHYGDDINTNSGQVIFSGVYSYSNSGNQLKPALSNAALNSMLVKNVAGSLTGGSNSSFRGINIEGGTTQWGDGTTHAFFLPSAPSPAAPDASVKNAYINLHHGATLVFDYNGKVTCNVGITGGGGGPDADGSAGVGNLTIAATPGNYVVLTMPQNFNGVTTIGAGATLQIGNGAPVTASLATIGAPTTAEPYGAVLSTTPVAAYSGDSSLLTAASVNGSAKDAVVNNGTLVIANTSSAIALLNISGAGAIVQEGAATTTLSGANSYSGGTTISGGTLSVAGDAALGTGGVTNSATLATASGQHSIDIGGDFTQASSGTLALTMGSVPDQVVVAGQAHLSGALRLTFASTPASGSKFVVVRAATGVSGSFTRIDGNGVSLVGGQDATSYYVTVP